MHFGVELQLGGDKYETEKTQELITAFYVARKNLIEHLEDLHVRPVLEEEENSVSGN